MEYKLKNKLPPENRLVQLWCINRQSGTRAYGNYKLQRDGVEYNWYNRHDNVATELFSEWKPDSWEE